MRRVTRNRGPRCPQWVGARWALALAGFVGLCVAVLVTGPAAARTRRLRLSRLDRGPLPGTPAAHERSVPAPQHPAVGPRPAGDLPVGAPGQRQVDQSEEPRLSVLRSAVSVASRAAGGAAVLRRSGLRGPLLRRATLARSVGRSVRRGPVLQRGRRADLCLARHDADLHRCVTRRGGGRPSARGSAVSREPADSTTRRGTTRLSGARWCHIHSLHRRRAARCRARERPRVVTTLRV